ncbi:hypothetical protein [Rhodocyclus tenuis]|uniref:hypothetical protein n=1 Tax=Rhodocyclus tenuis TaxID=1066 RepID=UPI001903DF51|nr:hypothetical protein [Rhodocyclus tenuis]MBK1679924.1 hypothetical protein [Rhodocyclus tenuis]
MNDLISSLRFIAVVDWLELEINTRKPTQGFHLHRLGRGAFSHAHGIDLQTGKKYPEHLKNTTTTRFLVRIQSPERFAMVNDALDRMGGQFDQSAGSWLRAIEVAFDAYGNENTNDEQLAEATALFMKGVNRVSEVPPRIYRLKNETRIIGSQRELVQALLDGFQIGIGNCDADRYQHAYLKTSDNKLPLPQNHHRARIEVRLQGSACPLLSLDDLATFNFAKMTKYFRFRSQNDDLDGLQRLLTMRQVCLGNVLDANNELTRIWRKGGGSRKNKRHAHASPLNEIARVRLRTLTGRWRSSCGRGQAPKIGGHRLTKSGLSCGPRMADNEPDLNLPPSSEKPGQH